MSVPKWMLIGTVSLFAVIGIAGLVKKRSSLSMTVDAPAQTSVSVSETPIVSIPVGVKALEEGAPPVLVSKKSKRKNKEVLRAPSLDRPILNAKDDFPAIDRTFQFFVLGAAKLPIVETITYASSVPWLKGRPAWIADYATHFGTSRHFIARSLNGKPDYFSQKVLEGSRFNVFRKDKKIHFHLLVDVSRCKMGFYYVDLDTNERVLLKTYRVGLGRLDPSKPSGTLTPLGRYSLGSRVAIYKPGMMGVYQDQPVEMIRVFGTRWIPLDQEQSGTPALTRGYGLQGAPWSVDPISSEMIENKESIGAYDSDGCIRLASEDIEELFAIVLTKPTFIEIVNDFHEVKLPGVEVAAPSR